MPPYLPYRCPRLRRRFTSPVTAMFTVLALKSQSKRQICSLEDVEVVKRDRGRVSSGAAASGCVGGDEAYRTLLNQIRTSSTLIALLPFVRSYSMLLGVLDVVDFLPKSQAARLVLYHSSAAMCPGKKP